MGRKEHLVECQIRCLEQEFEINELKKKKMNLEIKLLEKKINDT